MHAEHTHAGPFRPGDRVKVVGGTFIGMSGRVIDVAEAQTLYAQRGGQDLDTRCPPGYVWLALPIFGVEVPILLTYDQVQHATPSAS